MEFKQFEERLKRLEKAVFGKGASDALVAKFNSREAISTDEKITILSQTAKALRPLSKALARGDKLILQTVVMPETEYPVYMQISQLTTLMEEEDDDSVARLCGVLSSRQRIAILRQLVEKPLSSGELADSTGMAGGHLHHHLRELLHLGLLRKTDIGHYVTTNIGVNVYLTVAALHRSLFYSDRQLASELSGGSNDEK